MPVDTEPTLARSVGLFRAFRVEQSEPARFYRTLAEDSVALIERYATLAGATVLDVGGGPGFFADAFAAAGARYACVEADVGEMAAFGEPGPGSVLGDGRALPVRTGAVDVCLSSNVAEHVPDPWALGAEMLRVTRPGGLVVLSYTVWLGPWGGHETAPWHYLGGGYAARRYARRTGHPPKNVYGRSLFAVRAADGLRWGRARPDADLLAAFPRYLPRWAWGVLAVPGLRELATWNLCLVLRRRG